MAVIDRDQLLIDTKSYLPDINTLSDSEISNIIGIVVDTQIPIDDDIYYGEALCKTLRACAVTNKLTWVADDRGKKREKVDKVEVEYFDGSSNDPWGNYIESLNEFCPLVLGYTPDWSSSLIGIKIHSGTKPDPLANCKKTTNDLHL